MEWIVFGRHCKRLWKAVETKHLSAPRIKWLWSLGKFILPTYPWRVKLLKQIFQVVPPVAGEDNLLTWSNKTSRNALTVLGTVKFLILVISEVKPKYWLTHKCLRSTHMCLKHVVYIFCISQSSGHLSWPATGTACRQACLLIRWDHIKNT